MTRLHECMTRLRWRSRILGGILWLLAVGSAGAQDGIPAGLTLKDAFAPGIGAPVGEVRLLQGDVVAVHREEDGVGYRLSIGDPVFQGDSIFTGDSGKVNIELNDGSRITLATQTRMVIDQSVYNPDQGKTRASFVSVIFGKARFAVRKLSGLVSSDFKVRTKTAVVGVRGSDFVVEATERLTRVTAFEETRIEVVGLTAPCMRPEDREKPEDCRVVPTLVTDFQQAAVQIGDFPRIVAELDPDQIEIMKEAFVIEADAGRLAERAEEPEIRVSERDLTELMVGSPQVSEETGIPDIFGDAGEVAASSDATDVMADQAEEILDSELERLPGFPEPPR